LHRAFIDKICVSLPQTNRTRTGLWDLVLADIIPLKEQAGRTRDGR